jgi:hypothetical protein
MISFRCDVFRHNGHAVEPRYLFANAGVMRGHLRHPDWEMVVANAVTPVFAKRDIEQQGFCYVVHTMRHQEIARSLYAGSR